MADYHQNQQEETEYLEQTLALLQKELAADTEALAARKNKLIAARKDMYENTVHFTTDFARLTEANQYLIEVNTQTADYVSKLKQIEKYKLIQSSPYFGRFDFVEEGYAVQEKIYIGLYNVKDSITQEIYVYDWRAPISSIFYRYELGIASFSAPGGIIAGEVLLKRQYKILQGKLMYFFDCGVVINDEILQEVLSANSSAKMKKIVETIQKEQDVIIRDTDNEMLIVQGVAGSGKTSIALHRIAFLLYNGIKANFNSTNILILSPNDIFSKYISSVLPELGEENVQQTTFDNIVQKLLGDRLIAETRNQQLETLLVSRNQEQEFWRRQSIEFKGSRAFVQILDRIIQYYERSLIPFEDVYYDQQVLATNQQLKNLLLNNKTGMPMAKRLKRIEKKLLEKVYPLRKQRLGKIEKIVENTEGHEYEVKSFSRLLAKKESKAFMKRLQKFTEVDYLHLYQVLFNDGLLAKLAQGVELPSNIDQISLITKQQLDQGQMFYEDCAPLLYLKLRLEDRDMFTEIKQVVIDEAQDYYPLQYEVFKLLFKDARYTVLGDINQAIEKAADNSLYDDITQILDKKKTLKLFLNKAYRSSFEINAFAQKLRAGTQPFVPFERHEAEPMVVFKDNLEMVDQAIVQDIADYTGQGYESMAIICKTSEAAESLFARLKKLTNLALVAANQGGTYQDGKFEEGTYERAAYGREATDGEIKKGVLIIPAYMAKGLEFDVVIVHGVTKENYSTEFDQKLLYVACTRALHQLVLYYTGEKSPFLL